MSIDPPDLTPTRSLPEPETTVTVRCEACGGTGETVGYPGYAPQGGPDGATYTCYGCHGTKVRTATLTGRDALVMALGRAAARVYSKAARHNDTEYLATLRQEQVALAALSAFDASPEGTDGK